MDQKLLKRAAHALRAYAHFLRLFGVTNIEPKKPSPGLLRLRAQIADLQHLSKQLEELAQS